MKVQRFIKAIIALLSSGGTKKLPQKHGSLMLLFA